MFGTVEKTPAPADMIKDGTEATFMADVIEASQTAPVIEFYRQHGQLTVVDGVGTLDDVFNRVVEALSPTTEVG